jgi:cyclic pyranopterin phosphate synthase
VKRGINDQGIIDLARHFREIVARIRAEFPVDPVEPNYAGETADRFRYGAGSGEIASVTEPLCGGCTGARLSCDGQIYTCLFAAKGTDVRGPLRAGATDEGLRDLLAGIWALRADRYSEERTRETRVEKVEMYHIGG